VCVVHHAYCNNQHFGRTSVHVDLVVLPFTLLIETSQGAFPPKVDEIKFPLRVRVRAVHG
jgi:hypothetical protein